MVAHFGVECTSRPAEGGKHTARSRDFDFDVRSREGVVDRVDHGVSHMLYPRPTRRAENNDGNASGFQVLLILQVRIGGDKNSEVFLLRDIEQRSVLECGPSSFMRSRDFMEREVLAQRSGRTLVE